MLTVSDRAHKQLLHLAQTQKMPYLRINIDGGGCAGFSCTFTLDEEVNTEEDVVISIKNCVMCLVVDQISLPLIQGSEVDFESTMISSQFILKNPNATSSCGCGASFSL